MNDSCSIPLLNFIENKKELPKVNFGKSTRKHKKRYPFLYSVLSGQIGNQFHLTKNFFINQSNLTEIQEYLNLNQTDIDDIPHLEKTTFFTISLPAKVSGIYFTNIFIATPSQEKLILDILTFKNTELITWLSGSFEDKENMHISVEYNLDEGDCIRLLNLFQFVFRLIDLKKFDLLTANQNSKNIISEINSNSTLNLIHLDISNIREYLIPTTKRREHYRWQFCGPGRKVLRQVKVQAALVKEHIRKGKRLK